MPHKVAVISEFGDEGVDAFHERVAGLGYEVAPFVFHDELAIELACAKPYAAIVFAQGEVAEDGLVESLLDLLGIPYIGSSARSRAQAYDRSTLAYAVDSLKLIGGGGLGGAHVPRGVALPLRLYDHWGLRTCLSDIVAGFPGGYPLVVRALHQGKSVDSLAVKAADMLELLEAIDEVHFHGEAVFLQEWVHGVHVSVAVLGQGRDAYALPPVKRGSSTPEPVPLQDLSADEADAQAIRSELERAAVEAHNAYGARGYSRVDLVWDGARACVVEVDLAPALVDGSAFALSCGVAGVTLDAVLRELVEQAAARA